MWRQYQHEADTGQQKRKAARRAIDTMKHRMAVPAVAGVLEAITGARGSRGNRMGRSFVLGLLLAACVAGADPLLEEARSVASSVPPQLLSVLQEEIAANNLEGAIEACRLRAPQLAREASQRTGWDVRRVSLRQRNPKAMPDDWERAVLEDFDRRAAAGENPGMLEHGEVVEEEGQKSYRYMKALPVQPLCLGCHGSAESLGTEVREMLERYYPDDRAIGYAPGEVRGAMTVRRPL